MLLHGNGLNPIAIKNIPGIAHAKIEQIMHALFPVKYFFWE